MLPGGETPAEFVERIRRLLEPDAHLAPAVQARALRQRGRAAPAACRASFLKKLKHRNVGRVAILYLGISWVVLEPLRVIFNMLGVPEWINRLVVVFMALGFPIAVLTAWVYEVTPEGLKPSSTVDPRKSLLRHTGRRLNRAILSVLSLMVVYFLVYHFWLAKHLIEPVAEVAPEAAQSKAEAGIEITQRSIAVLPFVDMSQTKDQEYLSDGLAEELLDLLAKIPELRVAARTSAFAFRDKAEDVPSIAKKLHVAHILEGSVAQGRHRGCGSLRSSSAPTAATTCGRRPTTAISPTSSSSRTRSPAPSCRRSRWRSSAVRCPPARRRRAPRPTTSTCRASSSPTCTPRRASKRRSTTSAARSSSIPATSRPGRRSRLPTATRARAASSRRTRRSRKAREAASQALKLDPKSARAHVALGLIHMNIDWDWAAADREFKQALEYDPGNATVLSLGGYLELAFGHTSRAAALFRQALARDPLHASSYNNLGIAYYAEGRLPESEAAFRKSIELKPAQSYTHSGLGLTLLSEGKRDAALAEMAHESDEGWRLEGLAIAHHALGKRAESDAALAELTTKFAKDAPYSIATVHAYRGERDLAFQWLDRAVAERDGTLAGIKVDPLLKPLIGDPRYQALLRKLGLPD